MKTYLKHIMNRNSCENKRNNDSLTDRIYIYIYIYIRFMNWKVTSQKKKWTCKPFDNFAVATRHDPASARSLFQAVGGFEDSESCMAGSWPLKCEGTAGCRECRTESPHMGLILCDPYIILILSPHACIYVYNIHSIISTIFHELFWVILFQFPTSAFQCSWRLTVGPR